ncbi:hypothetical protein [Myxococcus landrumensis]|uniref:Lipoprotein n=1 Tax=Myxococcus landrumensis TaxID=2813577 RepID=A0ABX7NIB7_9BACT|nr:hypothetical protein [Myxococcus landrumus]QSQ17131.1 hypothetical protein JY572_14175 [Myxococcus landrumus]
MAIKLTAAPFVFALLLIGLHSTDVEAASTQGTIQNMQVDAKGNFTFTLTGTPNLCANGNLANNRGSVIVGVRGVTAEGARAIHATLMSAFLSGKSVVIITDETVTTTGWGCTVYAVDIF